MLGKIAFLTLLFSLATGSCFATIFGSVRGIVHDPATSPAAGRNGDASGQFFRLGQEHQHRRQWTIRIERCPHRRIHSDCCCARIHPDVADRCCEVRHRAGVAPGVKSRRKKRDRECLRRARSRSHRFRHSHHSGRPRRYRAHAGRRPHQQHGHDYRLRARSLRHSRPAAHPWRPSDQPGSSTAFLCPTPTSPPTSARNSIPKTSTTWKSIAAATARSSAIAPTACSTSSPAPVSNATTRPNSSSALAISTRLTTHSVSAATPNASPTTPASTGIAAISALQPPIPQVVHDADNGYGGFGSLIFNIDPSNQLRLVTSLRKDYYQIPYDPNFPTTRECAHPQRFRPVPEHRSSRQRPRS